MNREAVCAHLRTCEEALLDPEVGIDFAMLVHGA